jgi:rhodanese-related sulfurtransferase
MSTESILESANARARQNGLPYQGAVTPAEAYDLLKNHPNTTLVDVRTRAEWDYVGRIPGAVEIEILSYPGNRPNPSFIAELEKKVGKDAQVLFICRSGGRSHNAAAMATQAGYAHSFNVLEGFEGDRDGDGHRNTVGGWRAAGLPWVQG